jgi:hypothetical protein
MICPLPQLLVPGFWRQPADDKVSNKHNPSERASDAVTQAQHRNFSCVSSSPVLSSVSSPAVRWGPGTCCNQWRSPPLSVSQYEDLKQATGPGLATPALHHTSPHHTTIATASRNACLFCASFALCGVGALPFRATAVKSTAHTGAAWRPEAAVRRPVMSCQDKDSESQDDSAWSVGAICESLHTCVCL